MKTYILYQNGKLTVKEKGDNNKKISNFTKKSLQSAPLAQTKPTQLPIQSQYILPQKMRSHKAPPLVEPLKNINQKYLQQQQQQQPQQRQQYPYQRKM